MRDVFIGGSHEGGNNHQGDGNNNNNNSYVSGGEHETKDTDRLYVVLKPFEGQRVRATPIKYRSINSQGATDFNMKMKRIFKTVVRENPQLFTDGEMRGFNLRGNINNIKLTSRVLDGIKGLKKNYPR